MRNLSTREQRMIRYGSIGLGIYLLLFFGFHVLRMIEQRRADYKDLVAQARSLKSEVEAYQTRVLVAEKLMTEYHVDPAKLSEASVVAGASAAIQTEASADAIKLGTVRESPAQTAGLEMGSIHIEGSGPVPSMLKLLDRLQRLGYPLIIDSIQMNTDSMRPGHIKFDMTISVLDFDQWKNKEAAHA